MNKKVRIGLLLLMVIALIGIPQASAVLGKLVLFNDAYGTSETRLDTCLVCHVVENPSWETEVTRNSYGIAVSGVSHLGGPPTYHLTIDLPAIESIDSDGDGFTNLQEISSRTFPGDASDYPETVMTDVRIDPPTIIPETPGHSPGHYIIVHIELPRGYDFKFIDMNSITLGFGVPCQDPDKYCSLKPDVLKIGDFDGVQKIMLKFDRNKVVDLLVQNGLFKEKILDQKIDVTLTGRFLNQKTTFEGHDTIRVISKGK